MENPQQMLIIKRGYEFGSQQITELGKMLGGWIKNPGDKNKYRNYSDVAKKKQNDYGQPVRLLFGGNYLKNLQLT